MWIRGNRSPQLYGMHLPHQGLLVPAETSALYVCTNVGAVGCAVRSEEAIMVTSSCWKISPEKSSFPHADPRAIAFSENPG